MVMAFKLPAENGRARASRTSLDIRAQEISEEMRSGIYTERENLLRSPTRTPCWDHPECGWRSSVPFIIDSPQEPVALDNAAPPLGDSRIVQAKIPSVGVCQQPLNRLDHSIRGLYIA